jgi:hypothetical protein
MPYSTIGPDPAQFIYAILANFIIRKYAYEITM